ncbi:MAG: hypothetical protein M3P08_17190 [Thermoproteota archaeon]|nr:hypothetical protein [Thermoproteota archaeon]
MDPISNESVHHFVRGEASEFVITNLANMGVSQAELEMDGLIAHPDIMNEEKGEGGGEATEAKAKRQSVIVELKDTVSGKRLDITDQKFTSYVRQLLYYLVMTGIEKGIISIRYNSRELRWTKSDSEGDYFFRHTMAKMWVSKAGKSFYLKKTCYKVFCSMHPFRGITTSYVTTG